MPDHPSSAISHSPSCEVSAARLPHPVRITEQTWPEGTVPVVSICCITYKHEKYIRDAIDSFLMQETTFPVEIVIRDDASPDATAAIVRSYAAKYPQLFKTILHKNNQYVLGKLASPEVFLMARGEFIAFCEGDDYWTSAQKLQAQEEILRTKPDVALVSHGCQFIDEERRPLANGLWLSAPPNGEVEYTHRDVLVGVYNHPNTWMFRAKIIDSAFESMRRDIPIGDDPMNLYLLQQDRIGVSLGYTWSVYRQHGGGIWSQRSSFERRVQEIVLFRRHQAFYGKKYFEDYRLLIEERRKVLGAITFTNLRKWNVSALRADFAYLNRFPSYSFNVRSERWAIIVAALRCGLRSARRKIRS